MAKLKKNSPYTNVTLPLGWTTLFMGISVRATRRKKVTVKQRKSKIWSRHQDEVAD
jgi:hypothetical protein